LQSISYHGNGHKQLHKKYFLSNDMFILNFRVRVCRMSQYPKSPRIVLISTLINSRLIVNRDPHPRTTAFPRIESCIEEGVRRFKSKRRGAHTYEEKNNLEDGLPSLIGGKRDFLSGGEEVASVASNANHTQSYHQSKAFLLSSRVP